MNREYIVMNNRMMNILRHTLNIKDNYCYYCKEKIDFRRTYTIFNNPNRLICNNDLCLIDAMVEDRK